MDLTLVYFVYGLAFFSMGLALLLEAGRSPSLMEARVLYPLAAFGMIHGGHEWLEMFLNMGYGKVVAAWFILDEVRVGVLTLSFLMLLFFALRLLSFHRDSPLRLLWQGFGVLGVYLVLFLGGAILLWGHHADVLKHLDACVRYFLAVPAALLSAIGLLLFPPGTAFRRPKRLRAALHSAASGFILYSQTQLVVPPLDIFPADRWNTEAFLTLFGFPVQLVRAFLAVQIAISLIVLIHSLEKERQAQFLVIQQERMAALERLQMELTQREQLQRQWMRRVTWAQEEERTHLARELHDNTSQILTAFSLHLAALGQALKGTPFQEQVEHLQSLSRKMAQDLQRVVRHLRPPMLGNLGLKAALESLSEEMRRTGGLEVNLVFRGQPRRLGEIVEMGLYRIAQEALTNVMRHAAVDEATLELLYGADQVTLRVRDRGRGFDAARAIESPNNIGLIGMRERAESLGGRFYVHSALGEGTCVEVIVPAESCDQLPTVAVFQEEAG